MTTRGNVGGVFLTIAMTAALWAWSGGVASAQWPCGGEGQPTCPPGVLSCPEPAATCTDDCSVSCTGTYTATQRANVFTFGTNNSIQIKFDQVTCDFQVTVELLPTSQEAFQRRVTAPPDGVCPFTETDRPYPATPEIECNVTVDNVENIPDGLVDNCAVYHVSFSTTGCYAQGPLVVGYTIGWQDPVVKKNKHDYMLLRDPDTGCFSQDITDKLIRNYDVGTIVDPGLGGRTCCPSEYVVARQRVRPAR